MQELWENIIIPLDTNDYISINELTNGIISESGVPANQLDLLIFKDNWEHLSVDTKSLLIDLSLDFESIPGELLDWASYQMEKNFDEAKAKGNKTEIIRLICKKYSWTKKHTEQIIKEISEFLEDYF